MKANKFYSLIYKNNITKKLQEISKNHWKNTRADLDSMCGFKELNSEDLKNTKMILDKIGKKNYEKVLEVGCGIGRITFGLLYDIAEEIDLLDINSNFLEAAKSTEKKLKGNKIKNYYNKELQKFEFQKKYDLIFIQWVLEYIDDNQLEKLTNDIYEHLQDDGRVIIKENVNIDSEDNLIYLKEGSLIRNSSKFESIFTDKGFNIESSSLVDFKSVSDLCDIKYWVLNKNKLL